MGTQFWQSWGVPACGALQDPWQFMAELGSALFSEPSTRVFLGRLALHVLSFRAGGSWALLQNPQCCVPQTLQGVYGMSECPLQNSLGQTVLMLPFLSLTVACFPPC